MPDLRWYVARKKGRDGGGRERKRADETLRPAHAFTWPATPACRGEDSEVEGRKRRLRGARNLAGHDLQLRRVERERKGGMLNITKRRFG